MRNRVGVAWGAACLLEMFGVFGPICSFAPLFAPRRACAQAQAQSPLSATTEAEQASLPADSPEYRAAIDEAVHEFKNGVWTQARGAFARAHELQPSARTFRGLGLSSFYLLDYVAARVAFEQALLDQRRPLPAEQREELQRLLRRAIQETGRYQLRLSPASTRLSVDDVIRSGPVLVLARGKHTLRARSEEHRAYESSLEVGGGEDSTLEIVLIEEPTAGSALTVTPEINSTPDRTDTRTRDQPTPQPEASRTWTWVALAAAPVLAGVGSAIWFTGKSEHDDVEKQCLALQCDDREAQRLLSEAHVPAYETWSTVAFGAAAASLVTAGLLFVLEGQDSDAPRPTASRSGVWLSVTPTGATISASL